MGGTTGIGRATALAFAAAGSNVVVAGLGRREGASLQAEIEALGVGAAFREADVTSEREVQAVMQLALERFGRVHAAVNNAGTEGRFGPVHEATVEEFDRIIGVNLKGVWLGLKHLPVLLRSRLRVPAFA